MIDKYKIMKYIRKEIMIMNNKLIGTEDNIVFYQDENFV